MTNLANTISRHHTRGWLGPALALVLGLSLFLWRFDARIVVPTHVDWALTGGDIAMNTIGWEYYRTEPWSFPPAAIQRYGAPFGSSIGYVDGIPLFALPGKLIGGRWDSPWQYFGIWLLLTYLLQGWAAWLLTGRVLTGILPRLGGTLLLILMPSFLARSVHIALSTHGLVLLALYLYARPRAWKFWLLLLAAASMVHAYLVVMVLGLALADLLYRWLMTHELTWRDMIWRPAALGLVILAGWWLSGLFVYGLDGNKVVHGFGIYSANLNTLINPMGRGALLPTLAVHHPQQSEGFNYLGLGWILLWAWAGGLAWFSQEARQRIKQHTPLVLVVVVMAVFSFSHRLTLGHCLLWETEIPHFLEPLTRTYRSSGRFLWPLSYAASFFALWACSRHAPRRALAVILPGLALLQLADLRPLLSERPRFHNSQVTTRLLNPAWERAQAATDRLLTYPPLRASTQMRLDFRDLDLPRMAAGQPTSAAYIPRNPDGRIARWSKLWREKLEAGEKPDSGTMIIIKDQNFPDLFPLLAPDFQAYRWDGFLVCLHRSIQPGAPVRYHHPQPTTLASFLDKWHGHTLVLAARDEATHGLGEAETAALKALGLKVESLEYRCSWAAVLDPRGSSWEKIRTDGPVHKTLEGPRTLEIFSGTGFPCASMKKSWLSSAGD